MKEQIHSSAGDKSSSNTVPFEPDMNIIYSLGESDDRENVPEIDICTETICKDDVTYKDRIGIGSYFCTKIYNNVKPEIVYTISEDIDGKKNSYQIHTTRKNWIDVTNNRCHFIMREHQATRDLKAKEK